MSDRNTVSNAYTPNNLPQLLSLLNREKNAALFAGGSYILSNQNIKSIRLPQTVVSIGNIDELKRFGRTDRYIEIGSCVSLRQIMETGRHILPHILYKTLNTIATPPVRNLATLGGNICAPDRRLDCFPVLQLLNANVELRRAGNSRWIGFNRFTDENGNLLLKQGEVLTRVRIPFETWDIQEYIKIGKHTVSEQNTLSFCCLGRTQKGVINDLRFVFGLLGVDFIRDRELEAELIGKRLPFSEKERNSILGLFNGTLKRQGGKLTSFQKSRAFHIMKRFLLELTGE